MLDDSNGLHLNKLGKISSKKRQLEYIAVRVLLQYLIKGPTNIQYLSSGKPYLLNLKTNISISQRKPSKILNWIGFVWHMRNICMRLKQNQVPESLLII